MIALNQMQRLFGATDNTVISMAGGYSELVEALATANMPIGLAELHGGLCGAMCIGGSAAGRAWLEQNLAECEVEPAHLEQLRGDLVALQVDTWRRLAGSEMAFEPLLADDDYALEDRLQGLASFCHGFIVGLGLAGFQLTGLQRESTDEIDEIVRDFSEISQAAIHAQDGEDDDQADFALMEVTEYVRIGVQIVYEEFSQQRPVSRDSLH